MPTPFPDDVRRFTESTAWTFAKTYAATWPHEYVVRTPQNAAMVVALARHIFEHGVDGRFYSQVRSGRYSGAPTPATTVTVRAPVAFATRGQPRTGFRRGPLRYNHLDIPSGFVR